MIQNLAALGGQNAPAVENPDDWVRASVLFETTEAHELVDPQVEAERLLFRLFHEDGVRVFERQDLHFGCRCSADRVAAVLSQYPEQEVRSLADDDGMIRATCEFCSTVYRFQPQDIQAPT
jgi:molecular chaperone Hsp33